MATRVGRRRRESNWVDLDDPQTQRYIRQAAERYHQEQLDAPRNNFLGSFIYWTIIFIFIGAVIMLVIVPKAIDLWDWTRAAAGTPQAQPTATLVPWQPPARQQQPQAPAEGQQPIAPAVPQAPAEAQPEAPALPAPIIATAVINVATVDPNVVIVPQPNSVHATAVVPTAISQSVLNQGATAYALASTPPTPVPLQTQGCDPPFTSKMQIVKNGVPTGEVIGVGCSQADADQNAKALAEGLSK